MTAGRSFYGPDGMYGNFAGRDASRGMAKQSFDVGEYFSYFFGEVLRGVGGCDDF